MSHGPPRAMVSLQSEGYRTPGAEIRRPGFLFIQKTNKVSLIKNNFRESKDDDVRSKYKFLETTQEFRE